MIGMCRPDVLCSTEASERRSRSAAAAIHPTAAQCQDMHDAADHAPIIHTRVASRIRREKQCQPENCRSLSKKTSPIISLPPQEKGNYTLPRRLKRFTGPAPSIYGNTSNSTNSGPSRTRGEVRTGDSPLFSWLKPSRTKSRNQRQIYILLFPYHI